MSRESSNVFQGQLFRGQAKSKSWTPVCSGNVSLTVQQNDNGGWELVAMRGYEKVWEGKIDPSFKHRVRDTFFQWQQKGEEGMPETYGFRLKTATMAQQFSDAIVAAVSVSSSKSKATEQEQVVLKVLLPGKTSTTISVPKSTTVSQVLKVISQQSRLDPSLHVIALPPDSPHGQSTVCQGSVTVGALKSCEIHVVRRGSSKGEESCDGASEQTLLLQVELPKGERTVVRVSPSLPLPGVLKYICEKRNLDPASHKFDLPATEESLAYQTLATLKINSIRITERSDGTPNSKKRKKSVKDNEKLPESPSARRVAPPPPPPQRRRTQPDLMRELTAEVASRKQQMEVQSNITQVEVREEPSVNGEVGSSEDVDGDSGTGGEDSGRVTPIEGTTERKRDARMSRDETGSRRELKPRSGRAPSPPSKTVDIPSSFPEEYLPGSRDQLPPDESLSRGQLPPDESLSHSLPPPEESLPSSTPPPDESLPSSIPPPEESLPSSIPPPEESLPSSIPPPEESLSHGQLPPKESLSQSLPPPVAEKPKRKRESRSEDEADTGPVAMETRQPNKLDASFDRAALDFLVSEADVYVHEDKGVMGVKGRVKEQVERPEMGSITESLKRQVASQGRVLSVRVKTEQHEHKGLKPRMASSLKRPQERHQTDEDARPLSELKPRSYTTSVRRVPRGPAPPPPKAGVVTSNRPRIAPVRKAPARPAPARPNSKHTTEPKTSEKATEVPSEPKINEKTAEVPSEPKTSEKATEVPSEKIRPMNAESNPPPPSRETLTPIPSPQTPPKHYPSGSSSPSTPRRPNTAIAVFHEKEDGGKVLIVSPSPRSQRKHSQLVFNLPPPPPLELESKPPEEKKAEDGSKEEIVHSKPSDEGIVPDARSSSQLEAEASERSVSPLLLSPGSENLLSPDKTTEVSLLSNEYTNLDDICSSSEELLNNDDDLEPFRTETDHDWKGIPHEIREEGSSTTNSETSKEGRYDITTPDKSSVSDSDSACGYDFTEASPLHQADFPPFADSSPNLTLNVNTNNSNNVVPPPPANFMTSSSRPSFNVDSDEEGEGDGEIVLVSMKVHNEDVPVTPERLETITVQQRPLSAISENKDPKSIGTKLNELDTMVTSLQQMIVETTGTPPSTPPPPRPPLPIGVPPPPPPPPPSSYTPLSITPPDEETSPRMSIPAKPKPPPKLAVKHGDGSAVQNELTVKLKERQKMFRSKASASEQSSPTQPRAHSIITARSLDTSPVTGRLNTSPGTGLGYLPTDPGFIPASGPSSIPAIGHLPTGPGSIPAAAHLPTGPGSIPATGHLPTGPGSIPAAAHLPTGPGSMPATGHLPTNPGSIPAAAHLPTGPGSMPATGHLPTNPGSIPAAAHLPTGPGSIPATGHLPTGPGSIPAAAHLPTGPGSMPATGHLPTGPGSIPAAAHLPTGPGSMPATGHLPTGPGSIPATGHLPTNQQAPAGGDHVQMQLQFLQQQVFHQQMMQLQQQVQHLQQMAMTQNVPVMMPTMGQPFLQPPLANPALLGLQPQPVATVAAPVMPATAGLQLHPQPIPQADPSVPQHTTPAASMVPPQHTSPAPSMVQPPPPQDEEVVLRSREDQGRRKTSTQSVRSMVLGEKEYQFDTLMEEVRESDPQMLKKVPDTPDEGQPASSYTGMAAALAEALKQRRKSFSEKRRSTEHDESYLSEWGTP